MSSITANTSKVTLRVPISTEQENQFSYFYHNLYKRNKIIFSDLLDLIQQVTGLQGNTSLYFLRNYELSSLKHLVDVINEKSLAKTLADLLSEGKFKDPFVRNYFIRLSTKTISNISNSHTFWTVPTLSTLVVPKLFYPLMKIRNLAARNKALTNLVDSLDIDQNPILHQFQTLAQPGKIISNKHQAARLDYLARVQNLIDESKRNLGNRFRLSQTYTQAVRMLHKDYLAEHLRLIDNNRYLRHYITSVVNISSPNDFINYITSLGVPRDTQLKYELLKQVDQNDTKNVTGLDLEGDFPPLNATVLKKRKTRRGTTGSRSLGSNPGNNACLWNTLGLTGGAALQLLGSSLEDRRLINNIKHDKPSSLNDFSKSTLSKFYTLVVRDGLSSYRFGSGPQVVFSKLNPSRDHIERTEPFDEYRHSLFDAEVGKEVIYTHNKPGAEQRLAKKTAATKPKDERRLVKECQFCENRVKYDPKIHRVKGTCFCMIPPKYDELVEEAKELVPTQDFNKVRLALESQTRIKGGAVSRQNKCLIKALENFLVLPELEEFDLSDWTPEDRQDFENGQPLDSRILEYRQFNQPDILIGVKAQDQTIFYGNYHTAERIEWITHKENHYSYHPGVFEDVPPIVYQEQVAGPDIEAIEEKFGIFGIPLLIRDVANDLVQSTPSPEINPPVPTNPKPVSLPSTEEVYLVADDIHQTVEPVDPPSNSLPPKGEENLVAEEGVGGYDNSGKVNVNTNQVRYTEHLQTEVVHYTVTELKWFKKYRHMYRSFIDCFTNKAQADPFYYTNKHRRSDVVISTGLFRYLMQVKGSASITQVQIRQSLYLAMSNTEFQGLTLQVQYDTFLHFLYKWSQLASQLNSLTKVYMEYSQQFVCTDHVDLNSTFDIETLKNSRTPQGLYQSSTKGTDLITKIFYKESSDNQKVITNNNMLVTKAVGVDYKIRPDGTLLEFNGYKTKQSNLAGEYLSSIYSVVCSAVNITYSTQEHEKALNRLISDCDGKYDSNMRLQNRFFGVPGVAEILAPTRLQVASKLDYHPLAQAYLEVMSSDNCSNHCLDDLMALGEYIEDLGIKLEERRKVLNEYLEAPEPDLVRTLEGNIPRLNAEANFKKHELGKIKNGIRKYGRLFISMPGKKWIMGKPHWIAHIKKQMCETLICDGQYLYRFSPGFEAKAVKLQSKPFFHKCLLYPVEEKTGSVLVDNQNMAEVFTEMHEFCKDNPSCQASVSHGDDILTLTYEDGIPVYNCLDISNCDASHTSVVFGFYLLLLKCNHKYSDSIASSFTHKIKVKNHNNPREHLILTPKYGILPSGCSSTTALNSQISSLICLAYANGIGDLVGYNLTSDHTRTLERATFLARFFYSDDKGVYHCSTCPSTYLRNYGSFKGDFPVLSGYKKASKHERAQHFVKGVVAGLTNEPTNIIVHSLRRKFDLPSPPEDYWATRGVLSRVNSDNPSLTEQDLYSFGHLLFIQPPNSHLVDPVVDSLMKIRYGYTAVCL